MQIQTREGAIYNIDGQQEHLFNLLRSADDVTSDEDLAIIAFDLVHG